MSGKENQKFSREDLRKTTKFKEGDYRGINPREFFRSLRRTIGEIQSDEDFKYVTKEVAGGINISSEEVGDKTGHVEGRLVAESDEEEFDGAEIEYRRTGHWSSWLTFAGLGLYWYFKKDRGKVPLKKRDEISVLVEGEATERTIEESKKERTDIFANLSVVYAGDTYMNVDTDELEELPLPLRTEIINEVSKIYNEIIEDEELEKDTYNNIWEEFIAHLKSIPNNDPSEDKKEIARMQSTLNQKFEFRQAYSEKLMNLVPVTVQNELNKQQEEIMVELDELAEDMDVYVEREGLKNV